MNIVIIIFSLFVVNFITIVLIYMLALFLVYINMIISWGDYEGAFLYVLLAFVMFLAFIFINWEILKFILSRLKSDSESL